MLSKPSSVEQAELELLGVAARLDQAGGGASLTTRGAEATMRGSAPSVRDDGPCLAPFIEVGASPRHCAGTETHRARELALGDEPIDGLASEAGHPHDGWHAQEHWRHGLGASGHWLRRVALHRLSPVRGRSATLGCKRDRRRAGFGPKSCSPRCEGADAASVRAFSAVLHRTRCKARAARDRMGRYGNACGNGLRPARRTATVRQQYGNEAGPESKKVSRR